tara:strand:- start:65 stop:970 length:906 start_codon:yes stop_codon:yes gene_type:complete
MINKTIIHLPTIKSEFGNFDDIKQSEMKSYNEMNQALEPLYDLKNKEYNKVSSKFRFLSQTGYRDAGGNWGAFTNLEDFSGYHPALLKNYDNIVGYSKKIQDPKKQLSYHINCLRLLNVEKIINYNDTLDTWEIVSDGDKYFNINSLNRIFFIDNLKKYTNIEELKNAMTTKYFNPLELSYTKNDIPKFKKSHPESEILIKEWSPNKIIIEADIKNHSHFVGLSEIYYPNWEITSHDIDIIQINGLLRGFVAPEGKYTIVMEFNYNDVKYATLVSFLSFFLMLLLLLSTFLSTIIKNRFKK